MMRGPESYPYHVHRSFVERVTDIPAGAEQRRWVLRDDNGQQHHGVVPLLPEPLYVDLFWKPDVRGREQHVGRYRLHLRALLAAGYVRAEENTDPADAVRLRFYRGDRGVVMVQARSDGPALAIGTVDLAG